MSALPRDERPLIVAIGGGARAGSSTERALRACLESLREKGFDTVLFGACELMALPHYDPQRVERSEVEVKLVEAVRRASGILIGSPAYHGGFSGLVKNSLDLLQDTAKDPRPYLDGLPVGLVVTAAGWQGAGVTLTALRGVVHALRGWPTPLGVTINTAEKRVFGSEGQCEDATTLNQLQLLAAQISSAARRNRVESGQGELSLCQS